MAYAKALMIDFSSLRTAQESNDVVSCEQILQRAFHSDVRPIIAEARRLAGGALDPIEFFREAGIRGQLVTKRGKNAVASGL